MKIQLLYLMDCPWCVRTKEIIRECMREMHVDGEIEEILIDSEDDARKYGFSGSPTVRIDGRDVQEDVRRGRCLPCEELAEGKGVSGFVKRECACGCRVYLWRGKVYPYPPKGMIKRAIRGAMLKRPRRGEQSGDLR